MAQDNIHDAPLEPPRGMYPARLDDRGRIKLPVQFQQYLAALPEKTVFVTSLDRRIARIYPISEWREAEKFFAGFNSNRSLARAAWFNANDLGSEAEMDAQGRLLFSPELRRELQIENQPVHIYGVKRHLEVLSESLYQEQRRLGAQVTPEQIDALEAADLP